MHGKLIYKLAETIKARSSISIGRRSDSTVFTCHHNQISVSALPLKRRVVITMGRAVSFVALSCAVTMNLLTYFRVLVDQVSINLPPRDRKGTRYLQ